MDKFRKDAKLTHKRYGIRIYPAFLDIFKKLNIVKRIEIQRASISTSADKGECRPKKIIDQAKFKISWIKKNIRAFLVFLFFTPRVQTKKRDNPIKKYNVVQTGANIQFGGLKKGLFKPMYQLVIEGIVKNEATIPTPSQISMAIINFVWFPI